MKITRMEDIKNKTHKAFVKKLEKEKVPCDAVGMINLPKKKPFLEVILHRGERYSNPSIIKRVPKTYRGLKVKVL